MPAIYIAAFVLITAALISSAIATGSNRLGRASFALITLGAIIVGWQAGLMDIRAVAALIMLALSLNLLRTCDAVSLNTGKASRRIDRIKCTAAYAAVFALMLSMLAHVAPGFSTMTIADPIQYSELSTTTRLLFGLDKIFAGLLLIAILGPPLLSHGALTNTLHNAIPIGLLTISVVLAGAFLTGLIRFDPKLHDFTLYWAFSNLVLTCVGEEAFFRGFLQHRLTKVLASIRHGNVVSVACVSILFGIAHLPGGWIYATLAFFAGLGYGFIFERTKSLVAAILVHFALNLTHFIFFTYPVALPAP